MSTHDQSVALQRHYVRRCEHNARQAEVAMTWCADQARKRQLASRARYWRAEGARQRENLRELTAWA